MSRHAATPMTGSRYELLVPTDSNLPPAPSHTPAARKRTRKPGTDPLPRHVANRAQRTRPRKPVPAPPGPVVRGSRDQHGSGTMRRRKLPPTVLVNSWEQSASVVRRLRRYERLGVDCEGVGLSRGGKLCLVQVASPDAIYFFDVVGEDPTNLELGKDLFERGGLKELLEDPKVWKVMHDCRHDSDALYHQFGVTLGPVIDTQVVFSVLRKVRGMPEGLPVSMKTLLKKFAGASEEELSMKNSVKESMRGDGDFWLKRPLSEQAMLYARLDVEHLLQLSGLLEKYINSADKAAWSQVLEGSRQYAAVFRDDLDGPRKAQQQYEQLARVARRQRLVSEKTKRSEVHQRMDPMRKFSFDYPSILRSLS